MSRSMTGRMAIIAAIHSPPRRTSIVAWGTQFVDGTSTFNVRSLQPRTTAGESQHTHGDSPLQLPQAEMSRPATCSSDEGPLMSTPSEAVATTSRQAWHLSPPSKHHFIEALV